MATEGKEQKFDEAQLAQAVEAFQSSYDSWEEYGVSWDDAAKGLLTALETLGFVSLPDAESIRKVWEDRRAREAQEHAEREAARRAAMTPEQRERDDKIRQMILASGMMLQKSVLDVAFAPSPLFSTLRNDTSER